MTVRIITNSHGRREEDTVAAAATCWVAEGVEVLSAGTKGASSVVVGTDGAASS